MRKNVDTIRTDTNFNELLHLVAHSRYDRFPVIDREDCFEGVIAYEDIRDMLFDPYTFLVIAADIVKPLELIAFHNRRFPKCLICSDSILTRATCPCSTTQITDACWVS